MAVFNRYGDRMASMNPDITPPPIGSSSRSRFGRSLIVADSRDSRRTHHVDTSSSSAAPTIRTAG
jgi:hypothetical protein